MSEIGCVQELNFPGLSRALVVFGLVAGSLPGLGTAQAAGLDLSVSPRLLAGTVVAQVAEDAEPAAVEAPAEGDGQAGEDVPFSELNEALTTARSKLAELTKAAEIAKVAGDLREKLQTVEAENRQLKSVLSQLQTDNSELLSARQTAERRVVELDTTSEEAAAEARRLDEELVSMRRQNSELSTSLTKAETVAREQAEALEQARNEMGARTESLTAVAEESASEITVLQRELDTARERVVSAERQQAESEAELVQLQEITEQSTADTARLARDLDGTITELAQTRTELTATEEAFEEARAALEAAEEEAGVLRQQLAGNRSETDELKERLGVAETDLESLRTLNAGLEQQVSVLKTAAGEATDAARQNLLAVESRIDEINAALASVKAEDPLPGTGGPVSEETTNASATPPTAEIGAAAAAEPAPDGWVPRPSPPRSTVERRLIAAAAADTVPSSAVASPLAGTSARPPARTPENDEAQAIDLAALTRDLPEERRKDAEALLGRLKAEKDPRGLSMTVPGELLFAVNSEDIEPAAFDALSRVAELVDLYDARDVLIVGHTDAVGDAKYNQQLSERRASLVKQFFVENFEIGEERLQIEGKGEQDPINSNATADGRNANRRVEVVILK